MANEDQAERISLDSEDEKYYNQVYEEQEDLSIEEILNMKDSNYLKSQVFIILSDNEMNLNKQKFWHKFNASSQMAKYRFVQIKRGTFVNNSKENVII